MEVPARETPHEIRNPRNRTRRFWMPASLSVLGVLSMSLLVWIHQISQRQRAHFALANALMDLRIRIATSYLWLEEAISGETQGEIEQAGSDLREATSLVDAVLDGAESEHGLVLQPLQDPELRRRAQEIKQLLAQFGTMFRERQRRPQAGGANSRLERRNDEVFNQLQRRTGELETVVEENQAADYARSRYLVLGVFLAWPSILAVAMAGLLFRERKQRHAEKALQKANDDLEMNVVERTKELRTLNNQLSLELTERKAVESALRESEKQLQLLSAKLLTAQENERKRISTELHDELGHSLILIKLGLRAIESELMENQSGAQRACESLAQFIDQVIEDVRRLSRDLSPSILENLGLSAALRWLVGNCLQKNHVKIVSSIIEVDHLLPLDAQILLYRTVQEALTNVARHAEAKNVFLTLERHADRLSCVIEDDGKGFDLKEAVARSAADKGLGLVTMAERARMLGGALEVWSEAGKGTRITVGLLLPNEG